ncbi:PA0069 family radical SAM protein [Pseudomaricurvus alkylphenolicus]|uniref:PA0069 family radical SAM protein n=1 Tax=Pseudomaricurvus alkylphenolicus TaxID=1306991 RepID=UPI00142134E4|nr:PA0069 family radical SAM protein [Pseudomaricurvus alkylphenolicus]NIB38682.1 PA0069 family radical SAM protein [Pseudomaricurvus alkylphenolicus]
MSANTSHPKHHKGRGALSNPSNRYIPVHSVEVAQDWAAEEESASPVTEVLPDAAKTVITRNQSPDVPFEQSINPYRGCEHGCIYCFARPTHTYLDLSPGLDFETRLFYKAGAAETLANELRKPGYRCKTLAIGTNTDPYQPIEKQYGVMRDILQVLSDFNHPVAIVTKGALIERDLDLLGDLARRQLCSVMISVTTLDNDLKRTLEPRAASPAARLRMVARLREAGVPVGVLMAPVIPMINDAEMETLLEQCRDAGADRAGYVLLRLPLEVRDLFYQWLEQHYPLRAKHVISLIQQSRGGKDYQTEFGVRQKGTGVYAQLLSKRFHLACKKLGLNERESVELDFSQFQPPPKAGDQFALF